MQRRPLFAAAGLALARQGFFAIDERSAVQASAMRLPAKAWS